MAKCQQTFAKGKIWNPCYGTDKIAGISTVYGGSTFKDYILGISL